MLAGALPEAPCAPPVNTPNRVRTSPVGVTKSQPAHAPAAKLRAAFRSGTMSVRPSNPVTNGETEASTSRTDRAATTPSGNPVRFSDGAGARIDNAAMLARPFRLADKSARISEAASGCSVRTICRLLPNAASTARTWASETFKRSAKDPRTCLLCLSAARAPAPKPSCWVANCSKTPSFERFSACCRSNASRSWVA